MRSRRHLAVWWDGPPIVDDEAATPDLDLALAEAGDRTLPVAAAIDHRWHALVEAGLGQADVSAVRQGLGEAAVKAEVAADRANPK